MTRSSLPDVASARLTTALFGAYPTRIMLALASSIGLVALCFHLPWDVPLNAIGWQVSQHIQQPLLDITDVNQKEANPSAGVPVTTIGQQEDVLEEGDDEEQPAEQAHLPAPAPPPLEKLKVLQVLDHAEESPSIVGGLGAYYIHIQYPEEAIAQNIQGRLILDFIVEPDGTPSNIRVLQSLHPLCDSSAVAALEKTHFVPGQQDGETVRVRMRLPVRFKLLNTMEPAENDSTMAHR